MLYLLFTAALAAEPVEPAFVLVDRNTWLYADASGEGARLRADVVASAPEYRESPVVILVQRARDGEMVQARVVTQPPHLGPAGQARAPDVVPPTWRHCYPQAAGLAQLGVDVWVRAADLLPVLQREVVVQTPGGDRAVLQPGLAAVGREGTYRVTTHHLSLVVTLPDDALGSSYPLQTPAVGERPLLAQREAGTDYVHPTWEAHLDLRGDSLGARLPRSAGSEPARALRERCVQVTPHTPLPQVPRRDLEGLRAGTTSPIAFPMGTAIADAAGTVIGEVSGGDLVLWSRKDCAWEGAERGMCCSDLDGVEFEDHPGICLLAELPPIGANMDYRDLVMMRATEVSERASQAAGQQARVRWDTPQTNGVVGPEEVAAALRVAQPTLTYCLERALTRKPGMNGAITLRFALAPDGRGRKPTVVESSVRDASLQDCIERVVTRLFVPNQVSQIATMVTVRLMLDSTPKED